jgi:hypothetical protein
VGGPAAPDTARAPAALAACEAAAEASALDTAEAAALAPGTGWAREGPTRLRFRPARGPALLFEDDTTEGDGYRRHRALGPLRGTAYAVVARGYWEASDYVLVHAPTGDTLALTAAPLLSPDRRYVAAGTADVTAGFEDSGVEVVALTAAGPRREFALVSSAAGDTVGWVPVGMRWRNDTLLLGRGVPVDAEPGMCRVAPARLVRGAAGWAVQPAAR